MWARPPNLVILTVLGVQLPHMSEKWGVCKNTKFGLKEVTNRFQTWPLSSLKGFVIADEFAKKLEISNNFFYCLPSFPTNYKVSIWCIRSQIILFWKFNYVSLLLFVSLHFFPDVVVLLIYYFCAIMCNIFLLQYKDVQASQ